MRMFAMRYKKFPIFSTWGFLFLILSSQMPPLIFASFFSATEVGYYSLCFRAVIFPMVMLKTTIEKVLFPTAAKEYNTTGSLTHIVSTLFTRLIQIGVFPMTALVLFGPILFQVFFGTQWHQAGVYAQLIAIWSLVQFINVPVRVFTIVNRQEFSFLLNMITFIGVTTGLLIGANLTTPFYTLLIFVVISICCRFFGLIWKLRLARVSVAKALKTLGKYIIISFAILFPVKLVSWSVSGAAVVLGMVTFASGVYIFVLFKIDKSFSKFITSLTPR